MGGLLAILLLLVGIYVVLQFVFGAGASGRFLRLLGIGGRWFLAGVKKLLVAAYDFHLVRETEATCPNCATKFPLLGVVTCATCYARERRHFWSACGYCGGREPGFLNCPGCGLSIRHPLSRWLRPSLARGGAPIGRRSRRWS